MGLAGLVNLVMLVIAARLFFGRDLAGVDTLEGAHTALREVAGAPVALAFAVALLASGFASSGVGTYAGQVVMQGFLQRRIPLMVRRAITMAPALVVLTVRESFVDGLASAAVDREIVAAVIRLANALGMQTVAEGVETAEQLDQLRMLGCSLVQGYLISRPQPMTVLQQRMGQSAAKGLPVPRAALDDPVVVRLPA